MRVLHVIDAPDSPAPTTLALLEASLGRLGAVEQNVALLGGSALRAAAERAGIKNALAINVPLGRASLGFAAAQRITRTWGQFDLIHCWSIGALTLASMWRRDVPRVLNITQPMTSSALHWLRMIALHAPGTTAFLPISNTLRRALISSGVPEAMVHVLRPGLDMSRITFADRDALRKSWDIESDDVKVIALLSDPPEAADARPAVMAVSLAADSRDNPPRPFRVLLHPRQRWRLRGLEILRNLNREDRLIDDERLSQPWSVLPGCDAALSIGPYGGNLSLLWAMAANVPIVGEATYATSEIIEDRHSALLTKPDHAPALAHRLCQLFDDPQPAWKLRDTARHEAFSFFSRQRYCQSLAAVYQQITQGRAIEVPAMEVTGGLRFTGRA